jgi:predicted transcriptional regulator
VRQTKKNKIQHRNTTKAKEQNKTKFKRWRKNSLKIGKMQTMTIVRNDHGTQVATLSLEIISQAKNKKEPTLWKRNT